MRILVLVPGQGGERRAGPEIRGWEMVRALSSKHSVTAADAVPEATERDGVPVVPRTRPSILRELRRHDAIIGHSIPPYALAAAGGRLCVADLYDPVALEVGTMGGRSWQRRRHVGRQSAHRRLQLRWADMVLCANERQLEGIEDELDEIGRPDRPRELIVPMGLPPVPPAEPTRAGHPLRDHFGAIGPDDPVILWWGSVWRWLDARTAVEAVGALVERRPDLRLVITAGRPPNDATDPLNAAEEVRDLARERGLLDRHVFFLDEWVPFDERHLYLADADIGITLHSDTPEARLAARARYMDYIWASLPMVLSEGDELADRLAGAGAARLTPPGDRAAVVTALDDLLSDGESLERARAACRAVSLDLQWPQLLAPLVDSLGAAVPPRRSAPQALLATCQAAGFYARRIVDRALFSG